MGDAMASWLGHVTLDQEVCIQALARVVPLCS